ncbi:MAG: CehA/McbA family metallohydrolase, partial [Planctomycetota bacterium]
WDITVRRGAEHLPVTQTVTIQPGQTVTRTLRPERWIDMRTHGWYSGDDHVHFRMRSNTDADTLMNWIRAEDVHLANVVRMGDITRGYFEQRGWGPDHRVTHDDYILSPGQEDPRTFEMGHTLAMNTTGLIRDTDRYYLYDEHFDKVHAQGGITGYAHLHTGMFNVHRDMTLNLPLNKADFAEIFQFGRLGLDLYYDFLNLGFRLTASTGSDVPWGGTVGEQRVYAYIGQRTFNADHWFNAFRNGHTFVTNGPMINFTVNDALPGQTLQLDGPTRLNIRAKLLATEPTQYPVKIEIVSHGDVIATAEQTDPNRETLELEFKTDAGYGSWIVARAEGADGSRAHTTPVYVQQKNLRWWRFDDLDNLLAKRHESLSQIETLMRETPQTPGLGQFRSERSKQHFIDQSPRMMERVNAARAYYNNLQKIREAESQLRKN